MKITKNQAIISLAPKASFGVAPGDVFPIKWFDLGGETKPTDAEITAEQNRLQAIEDYQGPRRDSYPSLADQLDMQYWDKKNGTTTWVDAIAKVKSDNPKP